MIFPYMWLPPQTNHIRWEFAPSSTHIFLGLYWKLEMQTENFTPLTHCTSYYALFFDTWEAVILDVQIFSTKRTADSRIFKEHWMPTFITFTPQESAEKLSMLGCWLRMMKTNYGGQELWVQRHQKPYRMLFFTQLEKCSVFVVVMKWEVLRFHK